MNTFLIAMPGRDQSQDWTLLDATASDIDPLVDIVRCTMTKAPLKVVMRFKAPGWLEARRVFVWKVHYDLKVSKHLLEWEEVKLLLEPHVQQEKARPTSRPGAV